MEEEREGDSSGDSEWSDSPGSESIPRRIEGRAQPYASAINCGGNWQASLWIPVDDRLSHDIGSKAGDASWMIYDAHAHTHTGRYIVCVCVTVENFPLIVLAYAKFSCGYRVRRVGRPELGKSCPGSGCDLEIIIQRLCSFKGPLSQLFPLPFLLRDNHFRFSPNIQCAIKMRNCNSLSSPADFGWFFFRFSLYLQHDDDEGWGKRSLKLLYDLLKRKRKSSAYAAGRPEQRTSAWQERKTCVTPQQLRKEGLIFLMGHFSGCLRNFATNCFTIQLRNELKSC